MVSTSGLGHVSSREGVSTCRAWWWGLCCPQPPGNLRVFALLQQNQEWARSLLSWVPATCCISLFPSFSIFSSALLPRITATETGTVINSLLKINDWLHQMHFMLMTSLLLRHPIRFFSHLNAPLMRPPLLSPHPAEGHLALGAQDLNI